MRLPKRDVTFNEMLVAYIPFHLKLSVKVMHPLDKSRLRPISAYNVSTVRASEKVQLSRIESQPLAFQRAIG